MLYVNFNDDEFKEQNIAFVIDTDVESKAVSLAMEACDAYFGSQEYPDYMMDPGKYSVRGLEIRDIIKIQRYENSVLYGSLVIFWNTRRRS